MKTLEVHEIQKQLSRSGCKNRYSANFTPLCGLSTPAVKNFKETFEGVHFLRKSRGIQ